MREDPQPNKPMHEKTFFGDNFVRKSGDYLAWQDLQLHALQSSDKGVDLNVMVGHSGSQCHGGPWWISMSWWAMVDLNAMVGHSGSQCHGGS